MSHWEKDWLTYRNKENNNTRLHEAILEGDTQKAIKIIQMDQKEFDPDKIPRTTIINEKAYDNTPLTLALKRGMLNVALAISDHPAVNFDAKDNRGLRAFDIACMLRANAVIKKFQEKGVEFFPNDFMVTPPKASTPVSLLFKPNSIINPQEVSPLNLYVFEFKDFRGEKILTDYVKNSNASDFAESTISGAKRILHISPNNLLINCFTDIAIFHLAAVCKNLGWAIESSLPESKMINSADEYKDTLNRGAKIFCEARDNTKVDIELLHYMAAYSGITGDEYDKIVAQMSAQQADTKSTVAPANSSPAISQGKAK